MQLMFKIIKIFCAMRQLLLKKKFKTILTSVPSRFKPRDLWGLNNKTPCSQRPSVHSGRVNLSVCSKMLVAKPDVSATSFISYTCTLISELHFLQLQSSSFIYKTTCWYDVIWLIVQYLISVDRQCYVTKTLELGGIQIELKHPR